VFAPKFTEGIFISVLPALLRVRGIAPQNLISGRSLRRMLSVAQRKYSPRKSLAEDDARVDAVKRAVSLPRSAHDYGVSGIAIDEQHLHLLVFALRKEDVAAHPEVLAHFLGFECDRANLLIGLIVR
jgi:hypothetical protein